MAGTLVGTAEYMSREQVLSASHVDWRADLWALSVVAYEMLVGDVPFIGDNVGAVCVAICAGTYARPSTLRHELGPEVDAWFAKAFHADPAQRHQSARELAQSLKTVLLGELSIDEELSGELSLPPSISEPHVVIEMDPDAAAARSSEPPSDIPIRTSRRRSAALTLGAVALAALAVMTLLRTPEPDRLDRMALVVPTIVVEPAASTSSAAGPAASEGVGEDDVPSPTRAAAPRPSPSSRTVAHPSASSPSSPQPPPPDRENHHADELRNDYGF
jgi:serine/threonine-protein kinase